MATLKTRGTGINRSMDIRKDRNNPAAFVTLEIGDVLVSVNRAEALDAIGAVEPTPAQPTPTVTRRNSDTVVVGEVAYVAPIGRNLKSYEDEADYNERAGAENRAVAEFLRAEEAEAQKPVAAEIAALEFAYTEAFPFGVVSKEVILKLHKAGFRILP